MLLSSAGGKLMDEWAISRITEPRLGARCGMKAGRVNLLGLNGMEEESAFDRGSGVQSTFAVWLQLRRPSVCLYAEREKRWVFKLAMEKVYSNEQYQ
ncbi:hypothetical protein AAFF_G00274680 [Aldrovandia affinis]|uniref:Uncharacterized protein n=1 Tax=Aldrovandia affinis TaxID=143900 RepID=A0AAD7SS37_9TELE|nr:hypothetical protein AAFF_G00274680 [Aldrovandia affinis]